MRESAVLVLDSVDGGRRALGGVAAARASAWSFARSSSIQALLLLLVVLVAVEAFVGAGASIWGLGRSNVTAALHHQTAPAQLLAKSRTPTATML